MIDPRATKQPAPKRPPRILRFMRARRRISASIVVGVVAFVVLPHAWMTVTRLLVAWDITITLFLILVYAMMWRTDMTHVKRNAALQDEGRFSILIVTGAAAFASLAAIIAELAGAQHDPTVLIFATATIVLSWATVHTIFALHYAHEYYHSGVAGGMTFPNDDKPDYWDFVYFSFVIGMTAQVSDVAITDKVVRRTATAHGIISFSFNTALLALMINIAASAL